MPLKPHMKQTEGLPKISKGKQRRKTAREKPLEDAPAGGLSTDKALLQELKEKGLADRVELQTQIINGDLVPRNLFASTLGNIFSTWRNQFLALDLSLGDTLCAVLGIPEKETHKARGIMGDLAYGVTGEIKRNLEIFIKTPF